MAHFFCQEILDLMLKLMFGSSWKYLYSMNFLTELLKKFSETELLRCVDGTIFAAPLAFLSFGKNSGTPKWMVCNGNPY